MVARTGLSSDLPDEIGWKLDVCTSEHVKPIEDVRHLRLMSFTWAMERTDLWNVKLTDF